MKTAIIAASRQPRSSAVRAGLLKAAWANRMVLSERSVPDERSEQGQVISTLILTIPVLLLIFMVFFALTTSQTASAAQIAADAAVIHLQELDAIKALPPDDPNTATDERKEAFLELALSGTLIEEGRAEVYRRLCSSTRWIVGDACVDLGTNIPSLDITREDSTCTPPLNPGNIRPLLDDEQRNWPDVKVWISYPDLPVPVLGDCLANPLDSIVPGTPEWARMREYDVADWRVVVFIKLHPVVPALMTFVIDQPPERLAISCGPLFLAGADPDLWKC